MNDDEYITHVMESVYKSVNGLASNSTIVDRKKIDRLPRFHPDELDIGSFLGHGSFSSVYAIRKFKIDETSEANDDDDNGSQSSGGSFRSALEYHNHNNPPNNNNSRRVRLARRCRTPSGNFRFVVKSLQPSVIYNDETFLHGACDLAIEASILSSVDHPNIIAVRAISYGGLSDFAHRGSGDESSHAIYNTFFFIMDKLEGTLARRVKEWSEQQKKFMTKIYGQKALFSQRLQTAIDIAEAMAFLHSKNIIYRDLKPENIGFDSNGDLKMFDFGMATELKPKRELDDGTYKLTPMVGTLRYMAPEVLTKLPYNKSADVFSFGILLWHICSLQPPYKNSLDEEDHREQVVTNGKRPEMIKSWTFRLYGIMKSCWDANLHERPTFETILIELKAELRNLVTGGGGGSKMRGGKRSTMDLTTHQNGVSRLDVTQSDRPKGSRPDGRRRRSSYSFRHSSEFANEEVVGIAATRKASLSTGHIYFNSSSSSKRATLDHVPPGGSGKTSSSSPIKKGVLSRFSRFSAR